MLVALGFALIILFLLLELDADEACMEEIFLSFRIVRVTVLVGRHSLPGVQGDAVQDDID